METIRSLVDMIKHLACLGSRKRVAVVCATDESTQQSVAKAISQGWIEAVMVGAVDEVKRCASLGSLADHITYVDANDDADAAQKAVALVKTGQADVLMKGLVSTDVVLRAVLDKEMGLLPQGNVLTHAAVAEMEAYHKLLFFTDPAVIPYPTQEQRFKQVEYMTALCRRFGITEPRVALIHCSEKANAKHFPFTAGYADLISQSKDGAFGKCIVDGPLDVKVACNLHSMQVKGIDSPLRGEADILVFPDIEAGNSFYKAVTLFAKGQVAGVLQGTLRPIVLPSRGDDAMSKLNSLALACLQI